jgi:hypothetical protein
VALVTACLLAWLPTAGVWAQEQLPAAPSAVPSGYVAASEEVSAFNANLNVGADGWLDVTETISYYFPDQRHGIIRAVPYEYEVDGKRLRTPLFVVSVSGADGAPVRYSEKANGALWEIKIGDPTQTVTGLQTYVINYRVAGALKRFAGHDELYWNVTGHDWTVPVKRVAATVSLPAGVSVVSPAPLCYVGTAGSTDQTGCQKMVGERQVYFAANAPATVVVAFTPGVIALTQMVEPPFPWAAWLPLLLPFAVLLVMYLLWREYGRDPAGRGTIVVQYEAPDKLPPAMMGVVLAESVHGHDHAATIVDLAVRGYLKIIETQEPGAIFGTGRDISFEQVKDFAADASLREYERKLLTIIFAQGTTVSLTSLKTSNALGLAKPDIEKSLMNDCVTAGYFPQSPLTARAKYMSAASVFFFAFVVIAKTFASVPWLVSCAVSAGVVFLFGWFMPRRTEKGVLARENALGFKDYLETAEKYRLQWQEKENIFERFLPYAMAFGVVGKWSAAFASQPVAQPSWYVGRPGTAWSVLAMNDSLSHFGKSFTTVMNSVPPKHSGGSGFSGGFSGGGFGGGGGRSW